MGTKFAFYGGCTTIGGTIIELAHDGYRLIFDLGRAVSRKMPTIQGEQPQDVIPRLLEMGELPDIEGLFCEAKDQDRIAKQTLVAISHAHLDHMALLPLLRHDIPVLVSKDTKRMLESLDEIAKGPGNPLQYLAIEDKELYIFGPFVIRFQPVDHDIPGASAIFIETPDGRFVYSGDLRLHGNHAKRTRAFVDAAHQFAPDLLWIEGTRALSDDLPEMIPERELVAPMVEAIRGTNSGVYFSFYPRNPERIESLKRAAGATGRKLCLLPSSAYLYSQFGGDLTEISLFQGRTTEVVDERIAWFSNMQLPVVTSEEVRNSEELFMIEMPFETLGELSKIQPREGGVYIHSNGHPLGPYDEDWSSFQEKLQLHRLAYRPIGSSGHASREEILSMIETISPHLFMPIHTHHPERFDVKQVQRVLPEVGVQYDVGDLLQKKPVKRF